MTPNRLFELYAMAPMAPSETTKYSIKYVLVHNSAQRPFQKLSWGDSKSSLRALRNGANGAFVAFLVKPSEQQMCQGRLSSASFARPNRILLK